MNSFVEVAFASPRILPNNEGVWSSGDFEFRVESHCNIEYWNSWPKIYCYQPEISVRRSAASENEQKPRVTPDFKISDGNLDLYVNESDFHEKSRFLFKTMMTSEADYPLRLTTFYGDGSIKKSFEVILLDFKYIANKEIKISTDYSKVGLSSARQSFFIGLFMVFLVLFAILILVLFTINNILKRIKARRISRVIEEEEIRELVRRRSK